MSYALLKIQIGPVQDFIAQARSTRDLWSGSYLLSWLMGKGAATLLQQDGTSLIFPSAGGQPLISFHRENKWSGDQKLLLTPNLPNIFVARVPSNRAEEIAAAVENSIRDEWKAICVSVRSTRDKLGLSEEQLPRFNFQTSRFLAITWQVTPETGDYAVDYRRNGWQLDAVRQTRTFLAWNTGTYTRGLEKDSLTGKEESLVGGEDHADRVKEQFKHLFKHNDQLGALTLIKRVWHITYLAGEKGLKTSSKEFSIPSTRGIATRNLESDGDADDVESLPGEKYFAVLALDGDQIGKWIGGEFTDLSTEYHHQFSQTLATFALEKVRKIVEAHTGRLIYAGGDDVLAILPADDALLCAKALRKAFQEATITITGVDKSNGRIAVRPDCSVGMAMAHFKAPLQDVIREAQLAEKRAKLPPEQGGHGRSAVAVTLLKRSGETIEWGCQWDSQGLQLYQKIAEALKAESLSRKFPHRVCELLAPYRTAQTSLSRLTDANNFDAAQIIPLEFHHAAERQGSREIAEQLSQPVLAYLKSVRGNQHQVAAVAGLCQTVAFVDRNREPETAPQPEVAP